MHKLIPALAGLWLLAACGDPTKKHDYGCTGEYGANPFKAQGCIQFHITEVEGNAAEAACTNKGGTWGYHACDAANRVPGYCRVDSAKDYSLSGTPAQVYFYGPLDETAAEAACTSTDGGVWVPST